MKQNKNDEFLQYAQAHFDKLLNSGLADSGKDPNRMWMASLDTRTGKYPEDDRRPPDIPRRHYRAIDAPHGCSLYWDMPALNAARALSKITKNNRYADAADAYANDFLARCVANNGVFLWGNHYYWNAFDGCVVKFKGEETPEPVDFASETGDYHETRPLPPTWEIFWRISPAQTEREIRAFTANSVFDENTGGFNRHADRREGCAFLESGGIIAEALAWLFAKTGDESLLKAADRVIDFSFSNRNRTTGLLENNPTGNTRWDKHTSTTEVGLWAGSLLRAEKSAGNPGRWSGKADAAMQSYLNYGYDADEKQYYGRLDISNGEPVKGVFSSEKKELLKKHQPGDYADIWRPLFPAHDYPMPFAESCLNLFILTGNEKYRIASERWAEIIADRMPAVNGKGAYAEHYGRCIHFLWRCGRELSETYLETALKLAREAVDALFNNDMFRGHPGEQRYDAVDGVGYLLLALLALSANEEPDMQGSGW